MPVQTFLLARGRLLETALARREGTVSIFGRLGRGEVLADQEYCTVIRATILSVKNVKKPHRRHLLQQYVSDF